MTQIRQSTILYGALSNLLLIVANNMSYNIKKCRKLYNYDV